MQAQSGYCFIIFQSQTACQQFVASCVTHPDGRKFLAFRKDVIFCADEQKVCHLIFFCLFLVHFFRLKFVLSNLLMLIMVDNMVKKTSLLVLSSLEVFPVIPLLNSLLCILKFAMGRSLMSPSILILTQCIHVGLHSLSSRIQLLLLLQFGLKPWFSRKVLNVNNIVL